MQCFTVLALLAVVGAAYAQDFYTDKWDSVDRHAIIDNDRLFKRYVRCILEDATAGCPQEALELKDVLTEAMEQTCARCSPKQQENVRDTFAYLCQTRREDYNKIIAKIDPENKFKPKFEDKFGKIEGC